jgi:hypothetical protein
MELRPKDRAAYVRNRRMLRACTDRTPAHSVRVYIALAKTRLIAANLLRKQLEVRKQSAH